MGLLFSFYGRQVLLNHHPAFISHVLYQELAQAVHIAVDKFIRDYKEFKCPTSTFLLAGISARAQNFRSPSVKRGISTLLFLSAPLHLSCCFIHSLSDYSFWSPSW